MNAQAEVRERIIQRLVQRRLGQSEFVQSGFVQSGLERRERLLMRGAANRRSRKILPLRHPNQMPAGGSKFGEFLHEFHLFPPSFARTFANARERCAFTVPSLSPVAPAISLNSISST